MFEEKPLHVNATNVKEVIEPQGGGSVREVLQRNVDTVLEQRARTGELMFPHVNHPNFGWAVKVEDLIALRGEKFFEVYNGHPLVHNEGDELRPSTERMWDILLAERLAGGEGVMYGIAVDDAHNYRALDSTAPEPVPRMGPRASSGVSRPRPSSRPWSAATSTARPGVELEDVLVDGEGTVASHSRERGRPVPYPLHRHPARIRPIDRRGDRS